MQGIFTITTIQGEMIVTRLLTFLCIVFCATKSMFSFSSLHYRVYLAIQTGFSPQWEELSEKYSFGVTLVKKLLQIITHNNKPVIPTHHQCPKFSKSHPWIQLPSWKKKTLSTQGLYYRLQAKKTRNQNKKYYCRNNEAAGHYHWLQS